MKKILAGFLFISSLSVFADTIIEPQIVECTPEALEHYKKPADAQTYTFQKNISVERREALQGDPAIWSVLYVIKVEFPYKDKTACFLIEKAYLNSAKSVKYDPVKGRLLSLDVTVATIYDAELGIISYMDLKKRIRVNQTLGTVQFE